MREWKMRCCWALVGGVVVAVLIGASSGYEHLRTIKVIYGPSDARHPAPDPDTISALGTKVVPPLCSAIAIEWRPSANMASARIIAWTRALGSLGDQRAVPTLVALTTDPHAVIQQWAVLALWKIGDPRALVAIKRVAEDGTSPMARETARDAYDALVGAPDHSRISTK